MNRRDFLTSILAGGAAAAVASTFDLERALWTPGEKTYFLPTPKPVEIPKLLVDGEAMTVAVRLPQRFTVERSVQAGEGWRWTSRGRDPMLRAHFEELKRLENNLRVAERVALDYGAGETWAPVDMRRGDVFEIDGVYATNPKKG